MTDLHACIAGLVKQSSPYIGRIESHLHSAILLRKKTNNSKLFITEQLQRQCLQMTSQWRHHNKTLIRYSELNSLRNIYFRFFIFSKLTECRCFVTYLWKDRRSKVPDDGGNSAFLGLAKCHVAMGILEEFPGPKHKKLDGRMAWHTRNWGVWSLSSSTCTMTVV